MPSSSAMQNVSTAPSLQPGSVGHDCNFRRRCSAWIGYIPAQLDGHLCTEDQVVIGRPEHEKRVNKVRPCFINLVRFYIRFARQWQPPGPPPCLPPAWRCQAAWPWPSCSRPAPARPNNTADCAPEPAVGICPVAQTCSMSIPSNSATRAATLSKSIPLAFRAYCRSYRSRLLERIFSTKSPSPKTRSSLLT